MNEFPQDNFKDTSGGDFVTFVEFVTTMSPPSPESKMRPRYGMPDNSWRMEKPETDEESTPDDESSPQ